jgi:hypothetical protein
LNSTAREIAVRASLGGSQPITQLKTCDCVHRGSGTDVGATVKGLLMVSVTFNGAVPALPMPICLSSDCPEVTEPKSRDCVETVRAGDNVGALHFARAARAKDRLDFRCTQRASAADMSHPCETG